MSQQLQLSTAYTRVFNLGTTGLTVSIQLSKNGGALANPSAGASNLTAIGDGLYSYALSTTDTNTSGSLAYGLVNSATSLPPSTSDDLVDQVGYIGSVFNSTSGLMTLGGLTIHSGSGVGLTIQGATNAVQVSSSDATAACILIQGAQYGVQITSNGTGPAVYLDSTGTSTSALAITATAASSSAIVCTNGTGGGFNGTINGNITGNLSGSVNSVTNSVGSVTGNVGGNVVGSVNSVTNSVGSVTGNVGGNVVGTVGGVAGNITGNITGNMTGNITGNLSGSVGSVTGAVGSVTGNVGGNVVGSVGSVVADAGTVGAISNGGTGVLNLQQVNVSNSSGNGVNIAVTGSNNAVNVTATVGYAFNVTATSYGVYIAAAVTPVTLAATIGPALFLFSDSGEGVLDSSPLGSVFSQGITGNLSGSVTSVVDTVNANLVTWLGTAPLALSSQLVQAYVPGGVTVNANVTQWNGSAVPTPNVAGVPIVETDYWTGGTAVSLDGAGLLQVDLSSWRGTTPANLDSNGAVIADTCYWNSQLVFGALSDGTIPVNVVDWQGNPVPTNTPGTPCLDFVDSPNTTALTAIAQAIWTLANAIETGFDPQAVLSTIMAACSGKVAIEGTTYTFYAPDGSTPRIVAVCDDDGRRLTVTLTPA